MWNLVVRVQQWWTASRESAAPLMPYALQCSCGRPVCGMRQRSYQIVPCAGCGRKWFILPLSSRPPVDGAPESGSRVPPLPKVLSPRRRWRWRLAGMAGLMLVTLASLGLLLHFRSSSPDPTVSASSSSGVGRIRSHVAAGRKCLQEGEFQLAAQELEAAVTLRNQHAIPLPADESRQLTSLHRQAVLLADLLTESLEEILRRLGGQGERERQAAFSRRYEGRAVVFDTLVWQDATGHYHLDYRLVDGIMPARLEMQDLQLLHDLPLQDPQRLIFGARLAAIEREAAGKWIVRLEPASGVLLTEAQTIAALSGQALDDDLLKVVRRQVAWTAGWHQ